MGHFVPIVSCKLKVASFGAKPIIDKVVVMRSLALLLQEEGGPSLAMVGDPNHFDVKNTLLL